MIGVAQHIGLDRPRADRVGGDAVAAEVARHHLGEAADAGLGGAVVGLAGIAEQGPKRAEIVEDKWIEDVIGCWGGKLNETDLFPISVQTVGFGVHRDARLYR